MSQARSTSCQIWFAFLLALLGLLWVCVSGNSMGFSFQEVTHVEKSFLAHAPSPPTGITVVWTQGLSEKAPRWCDGDSAAAWLRSLPDVRNGIKISGMLSLLASSITVAQTGPPRASPKPQPCWPVFDASHPADRASSAETLTGRRQDS